MIITANEHSPCSGDEIKAAIVATTGPVENPKPSERAEGYGAVNAYNALYNNSYESTSVNYAGNLQPPTATATPNKHRFNVSNNAKKIVVSLSWLDPAGTPATTDTLVNDLDLYVGPTSDPKRYSITERDQSINRLEINNPSTTGTKWVVTVVAHSMWSGIAAADPDNGPPRQEYRGRIRVVTEDPTLSVTVPDRIVAERGPTITESFNVKIDATGAPVHGIRAFVNSDSNLSSCSGAAAHKNEHIIGILSQDYRSSWSEQLCFNVPNKPGTYPVTLTVNYTNQAGQTATIKKQTIIEVGKARVKLRPFKRNVSVGERTQYELIVQNASGGVGAYFVNISLDRPAIGTLTGFTVSGTPMRETIQFESGSDADWVTIDAVGINTTNDYGTATIGVLEAKGANVGKSNISVRVSALEDETRLRRYPLRPQGTTSDPQIPSDGLLNVTRETSTSVVTIPPADGDDDGSLVVDTPIRIRINESAITREYDADPVGVEWNFGDGTTGSGLQTEHTYAEPGTYEIVAQVSLSDGRTVELTRTIDVQAESSADGPRLEVTAADQTAAPGDTVTVTYTIENVGTAKEASLLFEPTDTPPGVSVASVDAAAATTIQNQTAFFTDLAAGDTYQVSVTYDLSEEIDTGTYSLGARTEGDSGASDTITTTLEVAESKVPAYDGDDSGTIDNRELLNALADYPNEVSPTDLLDLLAVYEPSG